MVCLQNMETDFKTLKHNYTNFLSTLLLSECPGGNMWPYKNCYLKILPVNT